MIVCNNLLPPASVVVAEVDEVELGVGEVNPLGGNVESEAVGPVDLGADDHLPITAVHTNPLNSRVFSPVRPKQPSCALAWVKGQTAGLRNVLVDQDHPVGAIGLGHLNCVQARVEPVDVLANPVIGQALDQIYATPQEHLGTLRPNSLFFRLSLQAHDLLCCHVRPVDDIILHIGGCSNHILNIDGYPLQTMLGQVRSQQGAAV